MAGPKIKPIGFAVILIIVAAVSFSLGNMTSPSAAPSTTTTTLTDCSQIPRECRVLVCETTNSFIRLYNYDELELEKITGQEAQLDELLDCGGIK